jgi:hypothetical protein
MYIYFSNNISGDICKQLPFIKSTFSRKLYIYIYIVDFLPLGTHIEFFVLFPRIVVDKEFLHSSI